MKRQIVIASIGILAGLLSYSQGGQPSAPAQTAPSNELKIEGPIRSIQLPDGNYDLPPGPRREAAQLYCSMCHTARYIMIQPRLSRNTWTAELTKMRKTFSGPIPEEKVPEIMEYVMSVRGAEEKPSVR
jgi:hypothetical protein